MNKKREQKFVWLNAIKAFALLWIFLNHVAERLFGYPLVANPASNWPAISERIGQLLPLTGLGAWTTPANIFRYVGWFGDQGVQLFLIVSGFGLTWSFLKRKAGASFDILPFYKNRAKRIYPLWWGSHFLFGAIWFVTGWGLSIFEPSTWLSFFGIRVTPELIYYFSPAWWYFWLILQLYFIYPFLWSALRKWGPFRILIWSSTIAFIARGFGFYVFDGYLDAWARGAIFITRLPEFVFGISLAAWMFTDSIRTKKILGSVLVFILAIAFYPVGILLELTLPGMIFAPFLLGVSVFVVLYQVFEKTLLRLPRWLAFSVEWVGVHSYSLYLVHHPIILLLVSSGIALSTAVFFRVSLAFFLMLFLGWMLEWGVGFAQLRLNMLWDRVGTPRFILTSSLLVVSIGLVLVGVELLVRRFDPQEVRGWGERPALEMDTQFGWKLIPSRSTRLRWLSYDYVVQSNSLGFPGPDYPEAKQEDVFRILVTGDAFSSAEGVDTGQAWPRLLESQLNELDGGKKYEVLNFAMTGYGPNQYQEVVREFAPRYHPDLILIEVFVNDFQDAQWTNGDFQENIGFYQGAPNGLSSILKLESFRSWMNLNVNQKLQEAILGESNPQGYFLGQISTIDRTNLEVLDSARPLVEDNLKKIQMAADQTASRVVLVVVPASVQVCSPDALVYYPHNVDLSDSNHFDVNQPQQIMTEIAGSLGLPLFDLRMAFSSSAECPYQPRNMHWTMYGHRIVAEYLADILVQKGYIP